MEKVRHLIRAQAEKKGIIPVLLVLLLASTIGSCSRKAAIPFSFAFYNVENLFDTIDDPRIRDNSHLPTAAIPWNTERYQTKLDNLVRVMSVTDTSGFPSLFGLCEVENLDVVNDLINHPGLEEANYSILHKDSPDERGIDVALIYCSEVFQPIQTRFIRPRFPDDPDQRTRDILYTKGLILGKDTLHVFINHWVSRWGGREKTEPHRRHLGRLLKSTADSIFGSIPQANIIIAGDLNDNPNDSSVAIDLGAQFPGKKIKGETLYNLSLKRFEEGDGTLYYRSWDMFDQVIVSGNLLRGSNGLTVVPPEQEIVKYDWMLYQPEEGPARPSRTAGSKTYYGGFSDHLPVLIRIYSK